MHPLSPFRQPTRSDSLHLPGTPVLFSLLTIALWVKTGRHRRGMQHCDGVATERILSQGQELTLRVTGAPRAASECQWAEELGTHTDLH